MLSEPIHSLYCTCTVFHPTGIGSKLWNGQGSHCFLQAAGGTPCTEAIPAIQHNNGVASHSPEFCLAEISSPVPARLSYQEVTACAQQPCLEPDGQWGLSWTLTLHASPKSRMILFLIQASRHIVCMCACLYCTYTCHCSVFFVMTVIWTPTAEYTNTVCRIKDEHYSSLHSVS